ncbi:MAG: bifunctional ornithine acetyltransferase/N-acetylglutamate synthase, partial [Thermogutta sp.]
MAVRVPKGYLVAGVHCGLKRDLRKPDLSLIVSEVPATAAGVYTQNIVCAAPVQLDRRRTPSNRIRVVVINSGNANACTGERGLRDAEE